MHFAPFVGHASPLLIKSPVAIRETIRVLKAAKKGTDSFVKAMKEAFPTYPGAEGLPALAAMLYK